MPNSSGLFSPKDVRERVLDDTWPMATPDTEFYAIDSVTTNIPTGVLFSGIPSDYRDLLLIGKFYSYDTNYYNASVYLNGVVGGYTGGMWSVYWTGSSVAQTGSATYSSLDRLYTCWQKTSTNSATTPTYFSMWIYDYNATVSSTINVKTVCSVWGPSNQWEQGWRHQSKPSVGAVTSLQIWDLPYGNSNRLGSGSTFELYGIGQQ